MLLNYRYRKTIQIEDLLRKLEILKGVIDLLPKLPRVEENLRRTSLLKSSLFSARIEGNQLKMEDVSHQMFARQPHDFAKREVFNILGALHWIYSPKSPKKLSLKIILKLHQFVLAGLSPTGKFRRDPSAIFNQAGVAVYLPPPPSKVPILVEKLVRLTNLSRSPGSIQAAITHFAFEKIHPFIDGNGRVGRLISTFILKNTGFGFRGLVSLEEFLEDKRQVYYDLLSSQKKDLTQFVAFFLEGLVSQAEKLVGSLQAIKTELPEDALLPRRREILEIIRDHQTVSFDFISRRFSKIPASTLHYDLRQLLKAGFIRKLGITRAVVYTVK